MANITINYEKKTINITRKFAKAASIYGSNAFSELAAARNDFPMYEVKIAETKKTKKRSEFKGLTFDYMEKYIKAHDTDDSKMKEYNDLRRPDKESLMEKASYGEIKQWFLTAFPEIVDKHNDIDELKNRVKKESAQQKIERENRMAA